MLFFDGGVGLVFLALWLYCLFDVITTDESLCRTMPKLAWVFIVLLLFDLGSVLWLVAGKTWASKQYGRPGGLPYKGNAGVAPAGRVQRPSTPRAAGNPDDDEEFMARVRARAEEQRRRYREQNPD